MTGLVVGNVHVDVQIGALNVGFERDIRASVHEVVIVTAADRMAVHIGTNVAAKARSSGVGGHVAVLAIYGGGGVAVFAREPLVIRVVNLDSPWVGVLMAASAERAVFVERVVLDGMGCGGPFAAGTLLDAAPEDYVALGRRVVDDSVAVVAEHTIDVVLQGEGFIFREIGSGGMTADTIDMYLAVVNALFHETVAVNRERLTLNRLDVVKGDRARALFALMASTIVLSSEGSTGQRAGLSFLRREIHLAAFM